MPARLTSDQVIALAPDAASVSAGRKLATPGAWQELGADEHAVWGLAKGSGKNPYQVAVDLANGPAFKCSCPSRKIPCKHVLGALLLEAAEAIPSAKAPDYVREWLASRAERSEAAVTRTAAREAKAADPAVREARHQQRGANIAAGLRELDGFLTDMVHGGFAAARERPANWWDAQARRLVDAQAPGLAEGVRTLGQTLHAGRADWPRRSLEEAARLYLVVRGWQQGDALATDLRADLRARVGWSLTGEDVRAQSPAEVGPWAVIGVRTEQHDRLRVRRTWLRRERDGRVGLILDFAAPGGGSLPLGHAPGTVLDGSVHAYPGRTGLRLLAAEDLHARGAWDGPDPTASVEAAVESWSRLLAADPQTDRVAVALGRVVPVRSRGTWWVQDPGGGGAMALKGEPWPLISLAGGRPVGVTGEWDGERLLPLGAHAGGRFWSLG